MKKNRGVTLIALVITIIILLILAGISIATLTGENGLLTKASTAKTQTVKTSAEEKVKIAVAGSLATDGKIDLKDLNDNLRQVEGLTDILYNDSSIFNENKIEKLPIDVVVDGYIIQIDENGKIKMRPIKPNVTHTITPDTQVTNGAQITIIIKATIAEGTITKIIKPDGTEVKDVKETTYMVTENDDYEFIVEASNGTKTSYIVEITNGKNVEKFSGIYSKTEIYTDKKGEIAKIPEGFAVGKSKTINTIEEGLVITSGVNSEGYSTGDEFVWIPVKDASQYSKRNFTNYSGYEKLYDVKASPDEVPDERANVIQNGGFYVSRFEVGQGYRSRKGLTVVKSETWGNALGAARIVGGGKIGAGVCGAINGTEYDTVLAFVNGKKDGNRKSLSCCYC